MTTPLEARTRILADTYMEKHPGVPRQEAKARVRGVAGLQLLSERASTASRTVALRLAPAFREMKKAMWEVGHRR